MATPYVTVIVDEVGSTQDAASAELESTSLPVLIVASRQTGGRGRSGNDWWSAPRATAASLAFRNEALAVDDSFTLTVGLAVARAIRDVAGVDVGLKWPNDIELGSAKVGGVLVERDDVRTIVGCGINLWWPEPPQDVAGLFPEDPGTDVGRRLSEHWAGGLLSRIVEWDRDLYRSLCATIGCEVTWEPSGIGIAIDVDAAGRLVVEAAGKTVTLQSGAVRAVRRTK